jgi:hypothetical protein
LGLKVLDMMLPKLSSDSIFDDLVNPLPPPPPLAVLLANIHGLGARLKLLKEMPTLDDIDVTVRQVEDAYQGVHIPRMDAVGG